VRAIRDVANPNNRIGIKKVYTDRFQAIFDERAFQKHASWVVDFLEDYLEQHRSNKLDGESLEILGQLTELSQRALAL